MESNCKLDETISFRLPSHTKAAFRKLSIEQKHEAEHNLRLVIAKATHDSRFKPQDYLGDEV